MARGIYVASGVCQRQYV